MLILLDQGTPVQIKRVLTQHTVKTAREQGWGTLLNGELLRAAQLAGFQVFITPDQNSSPAESAELGHRSCDPYEEPMELDRTRAGQGRCRG